MTGVAGGALIAVTRDACMFAVHARLRVLVTGETGEDRVVVRHVMARVAAIPLAGVNAGVDREVLIVLERGAHPGRLRVTVDARRREAAARVLRVVV